jgi:hypothetical protein
MREIISPLSGIRSPFGGRSLTSPFALFAFGEQGVWFDPSDVANLTWRRNLLTYTEDFSNGIYVKAGVTASAHNVADPDGGNTASTITATSAPGFFFYNTAENPRSGTVVSSLWVRRRTGTGTISLRTSASPSFDTPITVTSSWQRVSVICTASSGGANCWVLSMATSGDAIDIWHPQMEIGNTLTDYQRITDVSTEVIERFPTATLYQDTAGTTPVTTTGQSVGLMLDKSKGLVLGSELVTNGDFSAGNTGWNRNNASWNGSSGVMVNDGTNTSVAANVNQSSVITSGKTYRVTFDFVHTSGSLNLWFAGSQLIQSGINTSGTKSFTVAATVSGSLFFEAAAAAVISIDNISVKELPGNHAVQATTANRPIYGIHPVGGRRNVMGYTEELDNAYWTKVRCTISANSIAAPNGTVTADKTSQIAGQTSVGLVATQSGSVFTAPASSPIVLSIYARAAEKTFLTLGTDGLGTPFGVNSYAFFNLSAGTVGTVAAGLTAAIVNVGGGWFRCSVSLTTRASSGTVAFLAGGTDADNNFTVTDSGGVGLWGAQAEFGSTATAYQRVTDQYNVTEAGVPSVSYLFFDGVNDSLATPSINFTSTDKMTVFAGARKLSDTGFQVIGEISTIPDTTDGSFGLGSSTTTNDASRRTWSFGSRGTVFTLTGAAIYAAPITNVLTGIGDIAGDNNTIRVNGAQIAQVTSDQGTGTYRNSPLYIGARNSASNFFSGHLYSLIVRGAQSNTGQISSTETWVASKTGIVI